MRHIKLISVVSLDPDFDDPDDEFADVLKENLKEFFEDQGAADSTTVIESDFMDDTDD